MKEVYRENITGLPYSLHDARVDKISILPEKITMHFPNGYLKPAKTDELAVAGYIEFLKADLDFCFVYIFDEAGNEGPFQGEKYLLHHFCEVYPSLDFEIIDETYGYNQSKFSGYLYIGEEMKECMIEIYHLANMRYIAEE